MKIEVFSLVFVRECLGPSYEDFFYLPADQTRGGILLAWRRDKIQLTNPSLCDYHITATVSSGDGDAHWWITGVYGPQGDDDKIAFLADLHDTRATCTGPWLLGGDFNMITSTEDKNNS